MGRGEGGGGRDVRNARGEHQNLSFIWGWEGLEYRRALVFQMDIKRPFGEGYSIHKCFLKVSDHHTAVNVVICPCQIDPRNLP